MDAPEFSLRRLAIEEMVLTDILKPEFSVTKARAGIGWGQCGNLTGETLLVYGPAVAGETYDNSLYCLPSGYITPDNWDCDGFYVPTDRIANQLLSKASGPLAIKYVDFRTFIIEKSAPTEYRCFGNNGAFLPGEIHWFIPGVPYSVVANVCL